MLVTKHTERRVVGYVRGAFARYSTNTVYMVHKPCKDPKRYVVGQTYRIGGKPTEASAKALKEAFGFKTSDVKKLPNVQV